MQGCRAILVMLVSLPVVAAGGCHDPAATEATAVRQERIRGYLDRFAAHEADGSRRVRESIALAEALEQRHVKKLRHSGRRWAKWWRHDLHRWQSGQPDYQRRIEAELEGDQAAMEAAFRNMFY